MPRTKRRPKRARSNATFDSLEAWGATQEFGWKTRLMFATRTSTLDPVGWSTVCRACKGRKVRLGTALRLSAATGGAVPYERLTDERVDAEVA